MQRDSCTIDFILKSLSNQTNQTHVEYYSGHVSQRVQSIIMCKVKIKSDITTKKKNSRASKYLRILSEDLLFLIRAPVLIYSCLPFLKTVILKSLLTGGKEFFLRLVL